MINKNQETGEIEVSIEDLHVLNESATLPFNIREHQKANEALQMQYRYLAMRFPDMQRCLRFRSEFCINLREFLAKKCGFVEVETPTLFKATPGVIFHVYCIKFTLKIKKITCFRALKSL